MSALLAGGMDDRGVYAFGLATFCDMDDLCCAHCHIQRGGTLTPWNSEKGRKEEPSSLSSHAPEKEGGNPH
jgi:hypothetical protein